MSVTVREILLRRLYIELENAKKPSKLDKETHDAIVRQAEEAFRSFEQGHFSCSSRCSSNCQKYADTMKQFKTLAGNNC